MGLHMHRAASVAIGALGALALAGCGTTEVASSGQDRVIPSVAISIEGAFGDNGFDTVSVRASLQVRVQASDNAALYSVVTRVFADTELIKTDSIALAGSRSIDKVLDISLAGVRSGQQIAVLTTVADGAGNDATDQAIATAFDPNVPRLQFVEPGATVIVGGTYAFQLSARDTTGVAKVGFRATGAGLNRADSTLFFEPLPKADTVTYLIAIASSATVGTTFNISPFAENRRPARQRRADRGASWHRARPRGAARLQTVPRLETPVPSISRRVTPMGWCGSWASWPRAGGGWAVSQRRYAHASVQQVVRRKAFRARSRCAAEPVHHRLRHRRRQPHRYGVPNGAKRSSPIPSASGIRRYTPAA